MTITNADPITGVDVSLRGNSAGGDGTNFQIFYTLDITPVSGGQMIALQAGTIGGNDTDTSSSTTLYNGVYNIELGVSCFNLPSTPLTQGTATILTSF
jgi:hypothetical protein